MQDHVAGAERDMQDASGGAQIDRTRDPAGISRRSRRTKLAPAAEKKRRLEDLLDLARREFAEKKFAETLHTSDLILEIDPENFFALRYIARIQTLRGDIDRAEVVWRQLCAGPRNKLEPAINIARFAEKREEWETLREFADLALGEDPDRLEALRMAIHARARMARFADLFDLLERLYSKEPDRALGFLRILDNVEQLPALAEAFILSAGRNGKDEALEALRERSHKVWLVGARRAIAEKDDRLTGSYLRTVLALKPSSREAINGLAVLSRESLINLRKAIRKGDRLAAIYHAEITIEIDPVLVEAWFSLARLVEKNDPDRAAAGFQRCADLCPEELYYQIRMGRALRNAQKLRQALSVYEKARASSTPDSDAQSTEIVTAIADLRPLVIRRGRELSDEGRIKEAWAHFYTATGQSRLRAFLCLTSTVLQSKIAAVSPRLRT